MIVYLHGFRSSPASRKAQWLSQRMAALGLEHAYHCPALPASPRAAAAIALEAARAAPARDMALIGSSLGGYYATWVAEQLGCRAVLLNPAITPATDLESHLGRQAVFFSDAQIDFAPEFLDELRALDTPSITRPDRYFLVAATGDQVIDYRAMTAKYQGARQRVIEGGDHELSGFADVADEVLAFCGVDNNKGRT
jgi:uncharacterized protein